VTPNKPPLGVRPRSIAEWQRALEITDGMKRYNAAGIHIPKEWIDELSELICRTCGLRQPDTHRIVSVELLRELEIAMEDEGFGAMADKIKHVIEGKS